jgi:hypothetical protein
MAGKGGSDTESVLMRRHLLVGGLIAGSGSAVTGSGSDWVIVYSCGR